MNGMDERIIQLLQRLSELLENSDDHYRADLIQNAVRGGETVIREFLVSNELWGGAGSIADVVLIGAGRHDNQRAFEALLADLGELQMSLGIVNIRTASWVSAFREWQKAGI